MQFITGDWLADSTENTLTNQATNEVKKLEPIMLRALYFFASNSNKTVSHQELIDNIWDGRIVTEHVVYRVVKILRQALAPDDRTAYIQTIPKYGYKFTQSFEEIKTPQNSVQNLSTNEGLDITSATNVTKNKPKRNLATLFFGMAAVAILIIGITSLNKNEHENELSDFNVIKPLTTEVGVEKHPVYLEEIQKMFYTHQIDENNSPANIYVKDLKTDSVSRLTNSTLNEDDLTVSSDGSHVVFTRYNNDECNVMLLKKDTKGNYNESSLFECNTEYRGLNNSELAITKNAKKLYYIYVTADTPQIFSHAMDTGKKTQLTKLDQNGSMGEFGLSLSPDDSQLAFIRRPSWGTSEVGILNTKTNQEKILFEVKQYIDPPAWSKDGKYLFYIEKEQYIMAYSIKNSTSQLISKSFEPDLRKVFSSPYENSVIIEKYDDISDEGIWEFSNPVTSESDKNGELIISSSEDDYFPSFANKSNKIAFASWRSGSAQVWIKEDNNDEYRITNFDDNRSIVNLHWSFDDKEILNYSKNIIYTIDVTTGKEKLLLKLADDHRIEHASWSFDGNVLFSSAESGDKQVYELNIITGKVKQLTKNGAVAAYKSNKPNIIFLLKEHHNGLWQLNLDSDDEVLLFKDIDAESYNGVIINSDAIYYYSTKKTLRYFDIKTSTSSDIILEQFPDKQRQFSMPNNFNSFIFYDRNLTESTIVLASQ